MNPPIITLSPVCTKARVEMLPSRAVGVGVVVGVGVAVGVTVGVGVGVRVAVGVAVAVAVGVAVAVAVGVAVAVAVGLTVGLGLGVGAVYTMVSTGGLALSRVSKRFAVGLVDSSPSTSQPKLLAGLSSHDCTSAIICVELHMYWPRPPTGWLALTVAEKSPPCVVQRIVSKKRCRHVASFGVAGAPSPSPMGAWEVPSPQSASSLCSSTVMAPAGVIDIFMLRLTAVIVEPAGILPAITKASTPRFCLLMPRSP